jgi:hypothetical protein
MRRVGWVMVFAGLVVVTVGGCVSLGPTDPASSNASPKDDRVGLVVVNRTTQPVPLAPGFQVPACAEVFYGLPELDALAKADPNAEEVSITGVVPPADTLYFQLITSKELPQLFIDRAAWESMSEPPSWLDPKPDAWPACVG